MKKFKSLEEVKDILAHCSVSLLIEELESRDTVKLSCRKKSLSLLKKRGNI